MKKLFSLVFSTVLVLGILAGCGKGNNEASESNSPSPSASNSPAPSETNQAEPPKELSGKLVLWTYFDGVKKLGEQFHAKYPNVEVQVEVFPGDQYQTKLLTAMQSGQNAPDIFDLERGYIGKFINSDFAADLSEMGAEDLVKDYVPYVHALGRDNNDKLRALADTSSPGGFWYIKSVAKQYLGTDNPDEISDMVSTWDKIIDLGTKVSKDSGGKVHLIENAGDIFDIEGYNVQPWVIDGKLNIDPKWKTFYEQQLKMRANNVDAKLGFMSGGWANALNNGDAILTAMPAWAQFMVKNDNGSANDKFGLAKTPDGFYSGGTYHSIYSKSKNKELAYEFMKYLTGAEWQKWNMENTGNMPGLLSVFTDNMETYRNPFFGDQNILKPYYEMMQAVPAMKADKYGEDVKGKWTKSASDGYNNNKSYDDVVAAFKKDIKNSFPEIKVD